MPGIPVEIHANQLWQDSGVELAQGDRINIVYVSGRWTANHNDHPPKYYNGNGSPGEIANPHFALPGQWVGCLVGRVGGGGAFKIGLGKLGLTGVGTLQLMINDDPNGLGDNDGILNYEISN